MAKVKIHDAHPIVIPADVHELLGLRIGETIDFIVEMGKAALYSKRGGVASVRRLHDIVKHGGTIGDGVEGGLR